MVRYEVIASKHWFNKVTKQTASIYGSVPWVSPAGKKNWEIVETGYTIRDNKRGTVGGFHSLTKIDRKDYNAVKAIVDRLNG